MESELVYYDNGKKLFREGELIFINKAVEQQETHIHAHDFIEVAYVASGHGVHIIGDNHHNVSRGDLFIINYNIPHEFRSVNDISAEQLVIYNCVFMPEVLDQSLKDIKDFKDVTRHLLFRSFFSEEIQERADIKLQGSFGYEIELLYEKMYCEYQQQQKGYREILKAYVIQLLIMVFRHYGNRIKEDTNDIKQRAMVEKIVQYVKEHYATGFKLEELSLVTFLSEKQLCEFFKKYTGMTIIEFSQKVRIEEACNFLKTTEKKVIEIAWEVGYKDLKFFNQIFKRITKVTPREYRNSFKNCSKVYSYTLLTPNSSVAKSQSD